MWFLCVFPAWGSPSFVGMSVDSSSPSFSQCFLKFLFAILSLISRNPTEIYARTLDFCPTDHWGFVCIFILLFFYLNWIFSLNFSASFDLYFDLLLSLSHDFSISRVTLIISPLSVWFFIASSVSLLSFAVCFFIIIIFLSSWTFMKTYNSESSWVYFNGLFLFLRQMIIIPYNLGCMTDSFVWWNIVWH